MKTRTRYATYAKPRWAPPGWLFGPVWTVLYILIAISYGYVGYAYVSHELPLIVIVPFVVNLIANLLYTPLQFTVRNWLLATADIFIVLATLIWEMIAVYPFAPWVAYINVPYLAWVLFATVLHLTVQRMNS